MIDSKHGCPRIIVLVLTLTALVAECVRSFYLKLPDSSTLVLKMVIWICWGLLATEQIIRMIGIFRDTAHEEGKNARRAWLLSHKLELAFLALTPFLCWIPFAWMLILKLPYAWSFIDDEKVFQKIADGIAVILIMIFIVPFLHVIASALSGPGTIVGIWPVKTDLYSLNYAIRDTAFLRSFLISILVTATGTILSILFMTMAAYPLSKPGMPFRRSMMIYFMICMLFTGGMAPKILLMNALKLNNTIAALIAPCLVNVVHLLLLKGFFEDVPAELEESAKLDGASNYTILFRIIVPVAAPMIATVVFSKMVEYWNNIETSILYITSNQSIYPLPMYIKNILNQNLMEIASNNPTLRSYWDHVKMAYILLSIIPILLPYPIIFKYIRNGVTMGAVKG
mgnify:CR=1 FL=1